MPRHRAHRGQQESDRGQPGVSYNTQRHPVVANGQAVVSGQPVASGQPVVSHNAERRPLAVSGQAVHTGRSVADVDVHHESTVGE